jgi:hypothetical protein
VKKKGGKAAIMYDGWTSSKLDHYVGLFLLYCMEGTAFKKGVQTIVWYPKIVLLACSTMSIEDKDHQVAI